ncbi:MAG TPA: hypothetical protein VF800_02775 [Telluria sp.]|jgi:hypothetical protein
MSAKEEVKYDPNGLLNALISRHGLKNDAALARFIDVAPPVISKMRHHTLPLGDSFVVRCQEIGKMTLAEVRAFVPSPYVGAA